MKKKEKLKLPINLTPNDGMQNKSISLSQITNYINRKVSGGIQPIGPSPGGGTNKLTCSYIGSDWWSGCRYWTCWGPTGSGIVYGVSICKGKMDYWEL